jgi:hypothetical protein
MSIQGPTTEGTIAQISAYRKLLTHFLAPVPGVLTEGDAQRAPLKRGASPCRRSGPGASMPIGQRTASLSRPLHNFPGEVGRGQLHELCGPVRRGRLDEVPDKVRQGGRRLGNGRGMNQRRGNFAGSIDQAIDDGLRRSRAVKLQQPAIGRRGEPGLSPDADANDAHLVDPSRRKGVQDFRRSLLIRAVRDEPSPNRAGSGISKNHPSARPLVGRKLSKRRRPRQMRLDVVGRPGRTIDVPDLYSTASRSKHRPMRVR